MESRDSSRYSLPGTLVVGARQSFRDEAFSAIPDVYAGLPSALENIILSTLEEFKPRHFSHLHPSNDDITSLPCEGLALTKSFTAIKSPAMRQIILKLVMQIGALEK